MLDNIYEHEDTKVISIMNKATFSTLYQHWSKMKKKKDLNLHKNGIETEWRWKLVKNPVAYKSLEWGNVVVTSKWNYWGRKLCLFYMRAQVCHRAGFLKWGPLDPRGPWRVFRGSKEVFQMFIYILKTLLWQKS